MTKEISLWTDQSKLEELKKLYAADLTEGEFSIFVQIGNATQLNPWLREIWAVKYNPKDKASIFIGRDGYRKGAQLHKKYDYHAVDAVYSNDSFNIEDGEIRHTYTIQDRGALIGAYCVVKRKGSSRPIYNYVELKEYTRPHGVWKDKPATMIKKVAEAQGLRMAFQDLFAGTYDESEDWNDQAPKTTISEVPVQVNQVTGEIVPEKVDHNPATTGEVVSAPAKKYLRGDGPLPWTDVEIKELVRTEDFDLDFWKSKNGADCFVIINNKGEWAWLKSWTYDALIRNRTAKLVKKAEEVFNESV